MKIVITGGHHSSALPVIQELQSQSPDVEILWFGHRNSQKGNTADTLEYKEISALKIPFYVIKTGKFYKSLSLINIFKILYGFIQSFGLLAKTKPDVILSFGGYLAVPVVLSGWLLGIPSITHEQTLVAGYANKLISRFAKKVLISWESSEKYFPQNKVVLVGLPLRDSIYKATSNDFEIKNKLPIVYITGGKTGSHQLNLLIKDAVRELLQFCNVIHQCGEHSVFKDFENLEGYHANIKDTLSKDSGVYFITKFVLEDQIGEIFKKSDLVVSRAGAHTTAELISLEKPAILIPISWVSHNEQYENAKMFQNTGLGELLEETNLTKEKFVEVIKSTLDNLDSYKLKDPSIKKVFKKDCAKLIAHAVFAYQKKN